MDLTKVKMTWHAARILAMKDRVKGCQHTDCWKGEYAVVYFNIYPAEDNPPEQQLLYTVQLHLCFTHAKEVAPPGVSVS